MPDLEKRLGSLEAQVKEPLINALLEPSINPREKFQEMPYLKDDNQTGFIVNYLQNHGFSDEEGRNAEQLKEVVKNAYNKEVLKRPIYGIHSGKNVPNEVISGLNLHEALCFYAGLWIKKSSTGVKPSKEELEVGTVPEIVAHYIVTGHNFLMNIHGREYISKPEIHIKTSMDELKKLDWQYHLKVAASVINDIEDLLDLRIEAGRYPGALPFVEDMIRQLSQKNKYSEKDLAKISRRYGNDAAALIMPESAKEKPQQMSLF